MTSSRRRFGRVRKLPSGRWQARYAGPDGHDRAAPTTFATKTDANKFLAATEVDMGRGTWLDPTRGAITLRKYADAWLPTRTVKSRPLSERTQSDYRALLKLHVYPTLGDLPLEKLTSERIRLWHAHVAQSGAPTAARAHRMLHAILATATLDGSFARNPCQLRGASQPHTQERPLVAIEDVEALSGFMPAHLTAFVTLAFWAGLRLGELLALERQDCVINKKRGTGTVRIERQQQEIERRPVVGTPKADSIRVVNLPTPAVLALSAHFEKQGLVLPTARVFTRPDGQPLRSFDVHRYWARARTKANLPGLHVHDLRHGGLTLAGQTGATLAELMRRAGHKSPRAAMIYQHAAADRDADLAAQMSLVARKTKAQRARSGQAGVVDLPMARPNKA